ncbi:MAG: DUF2283 domain-containing protein, partial [Promethearchaeota archaeon]
ALYLKFSHEEIYSSEEISDGIIIDYGKEENIIGIEILNFSEHKLNLNELILMQEEEIIPMIASCK